MSLSQDAKHASTPLPLPAHFAQAQQPFSIKKRRLPFSSHSTSSSSLSPPFLSQSLPPRPPSKGCPPLSRVFPHQSPSPWTPLSCSLSQTPLPPSLYDPCKSQSFFSQCFINLGLLGRGSFGVVYKVLSLQDGQHYAIKRSVQRFRGDRDRQRSVREARNHECLCPHPHILGFKAAWEETGHLYIQTELCCTSLLMHTEAQPHSPEESVAWAYLCDLLSALQHLHSRGFVHLDLKPANVFMTRSGRLKLGDFGLLLELAGERRGQLGGTEGEEKEEGQEGDPRYMAPELLRGEYTPAADVFSLGVSILELACNMEVPKGGDGWQQLRQGNLPSAFVNGLSGDLQSVLRMMLSPDPSMRATVPQLLALPMVRRWRWRRQVSLFLGESLLFLFSLCQTVLSTARGLLSSVHLPFQTGRVPSVPCTPPRDSWGNDADCSSPLPSFSFADTGSLEEDVVFLPEEMGPKYSPTLFHRTKSLVFVGGTSTPHPKSPTPTPTPTHSSTHNLSLTHTPTSTHTSRLKHHQVATSNQRLVDTGIKAHTSDTLTPSSACNSANTENQQPTATRTHSPVLNWIRPEPCLRPTFEPKNLLSLFDETALEGQS
ncbi:membrane-associated tyrosine- and threonine-specific cdc2-inhibitory kinase [Conger conger]|uniref:membrane-associated tyrosine- and threonine-specific cdc2-inhibitory kinase n=1 Tax=Conger conger TaxID=82655 RepID=UPI002A5AC76C|nr:membrane-associated tyrosine- and threonine-specific cdc2-inhibitory kinase [Conger conger]XP_061086772.1 membrane-associated tyrosine- and threonine-specific cdc2-inhibitory kinase [Conger conger]XP_061086773.1 membrane-associated tyrosine- and threonine-specific cdc2-inhibitory kinase [Conger conger]XP_061086774.1 membrane-associated tyrosine- and threonine-specific cdc2-inhibitory kinase [Conger conger]